MKQSEKDFLRSIFTAEYREYLKAHRPFVRDSKAAASRVSRMSMLISIMSAFDVPFNDIIENEEVKNDYTDFTN